MSATTAFASPPTTTAATEKRPPYQPYQCQVCQSRFTRHENLKRHSALHTRSQEESSFPCEHCNTTFSRPDLRDRHVKRKHPEQERKRPCRRRSPLEARTPPSHHGSSASDGGGAGDTRSRARQHAGTALSVSPADGLTPLANPSDADLDMGEACASGALWRPSPQFTQGLPHARHPHRPHNHVDRHVPALSSAGSAGEGLSHIFQSAANLDLAAMHFLDPPPDFFGPMMTTSQSPLGFNANIPDTLFSMDTPTPMDPTAQDFMPTPSQIARGCALFFAHVSHFVPFLHQPTFDSFLTTKHLLLAMLSLGYHYGEDPDIEMAQQEGSGAALSKRLFDQARRLVGALGEDTSDNPTDSLVLVQTHLLLQICAMLYLCGAGPSSFGLKTHSKTISLARAAGLMQPASPAAAASTQDLESLWRQFVQAESRKRTLFTVHQVDTLWYTFLSIPRSISHLEVKHDMPCPEDSWAAASAGEWAHRQLVAKLHQVPGASASSSSFIAYPEVVRRFLTSADPGALGGSIPAFDPFGAVNIAHFLVSSAREISGWSTMTGMVSTERLEPLQASLAALRPFIQRHNEAGAAAPTRGASSSLCEATWETAMIEMLMWSPGHTGGIVEGSIDAALHQMTYLAPSCEFLCEPSTAKAIQPHVDWFLRYLDDGSGAAGREEVTASIAEPPWVTLYAYRAFMIAWQLVRGGVPGAMAAVGVADDDVEAALGWARDAFRRRERWQLGKIILTCLDSLGDV